MPIDLNPGRPMDADPKDLGMAPGVLRSFESFEAAQAVRTALIDAGLSADAVRIDVREDEAGPVEGNFMSGNGRGPSVTGPGVVPDVSPKVPYETNFAKVVTRGVYLLIVERIPPSCRAAVAGLLAESPGVDLNSIVPPPPSSPSSRTR
jgi:hypothetical protein